jgi:hypothetical protein
MRSKMLEYLSQVNFSSDKERYFWIDNNGLIVWRPNRSERKRCTYIGDVDFSLLSDADLFNYFVTIVHREWTQR